MTGRLNLLAVRGNWEYYRALHFLFNAFALRGAYRDGSRPKASSLQAVRPMAALGANADVRYGSLADITAATRFVRFVAIAEPVQAVAKSKPKDRPE